ncbi:retrovirus-related pol polyprotein from transposon TNT 1-94 [Tanacetum coccineum]
MLFLRQIVNASNVVSIQLFAFFIEFVLPPKRGLDGCPDLFWHHPWHENAEMIVEHPISSMCSSFPFFLISKLFLPVGAGRERNPVYTILTFGDKIKSVISYETAKDTSTDLVHSFEGPSDTKENMIMDLKLKYKMFKAKPSNTLSKTYTHYKTLLNEVANDGVTLSKNEINVGFVNSLPEKWLIFSYGLRNENHTQTLDLADIYGRFDFQENSDDEVDERTSEEYLIDLDIEFHERDLLANSKCFIKRKNNFSVQKQMKTLNVTNVAKKDGEEVSDDEEETRVQVLMALANDELSVGKNHARNGEWIYLTMKKVNILLSMDEDSNWHNYLKYINIDLKGGVLAESSQSSESSIGMSFTTCGSSVHSTTDHNDFEHFKREQPGSKVVFGDNSSCITEGYDSINCDGIVFSKVYILRKKSQAAEMIMSFVKMVENQNDVNVKQIRTNNGTKFRNTKLESFCDEKGISQNFSYPYTPEQNGVIERKNRTLIEAARTMLNGSILSKHYWTKAVRITCYTQNRSIIDHLGKFDEKANDGYFFGYSFNSKAFRVFNTRRQQIEETYHVTFDESIKAIRFTNTSVDETGIDDSSRYPPNEFLQGDDPSRQY